MKIPRIELLYRYSDSADAVPVLFVHGIFSGAWIWDEYFLPWFAKQGFHAYALSFRGHGRSSAPDPSGQYLLQEYVQDLADAIETITLSQGQAPLLVGHSMGGMVIQKYLTLQPGRGAVLLTSVPPQGLVPVSCFSLLSHPLESLTLSRSYFFPELTTPAEFHQAMFARPVDPRRLLIWMSLMVPESFNLLLDMTWRDLPNPFLVRRTPIKVLGAQHDKIIPPAAVQLTAATYGVRVRWVDTGHGVMLDGGWEAAAQELKKLLEELK